jgi:hypothetical protein
VCVAAIPVDVTLLLDVSGSTQATLRMAISALQTNLVAPLLALPGVNVGVSYTCDFPVSPYGSSGDRAFTGALQPITDITMVDAAINAWPMMAGGDTLDGMVPALGTLVGLPIDPTSQAITCMAGRVPGGCWRAGVQQVIVLFTDDEFHGGPLPTGTGLDGVYTGITPAPATWPSVLPAMRSAGTILLFMNANTMGTGAPGYPQWQRMLSDLGQPSTDVYPAYSTALALSGSDSVVARIHVIRGM